MPHVFLQCVKEGNKLRVKIISNGYNNTANCQFPKNIRVEGQKYKVPDYAIKVVQRGVDKFFYNVNKSLIELVGPDIVLDKVDKIYEMENCCVCLDNECNMVMVPCGHLCLCSGCSKSYKTQKCPLCRSDIITRIDKSKLQ